MEFGQIHILLCFDQFRFILASDSMEQIFFKGMPYSEGTTLLAQELIIFNIETIISLSKANLYLLYSSHKHTYPILLRKNTVI